MKPIDDSWALTLAYAIAVVVILIDLLYWRP